MEGRKRKSRTYCTAGTLNRNVGTDPLRKKVAGEPEEAMCSEEDECKRRAEGKGDNELWVTRVIDDW